jgi:hypothetical protein
MYLLVLLGACLAVPARSLNFRSKQSKTLLASESGSVERCSLQQAAESELWLTRDGAKKELNCMPATLPGIDFVSFIHRRKSNEKATLVAKEIPLSQTMQDWGDGRGNGTIGGSCLADCEPGYCAWCGDGAACCQKDNSQDPEECKGVEKFWSDAGHHECVQPPVAKFDEVTDDKSPNQLVVWVSGYPRSGSSILLSMVSATVDNNREGGHTFSLFEPCHDGDVYGDKLSKRGCHQLLYGVSHCEFGGIEDLWGWRDPHSTNNYSKQFNGAQAKEMCQESDIVAFKTVDWGHNLPDWQWLLDSRENMKVLDMVRDPRAIYSSWKRLEPFSSMVEAHNFYTLEEICDHFAMNLAFNDTRVKRVIFEDLMSHPKPVTQHVYEFLGQAWTDDQEQWLTSAFNAKECPPPPPGMEGFTDCHTYTGNDPRGDEKWRQDLNATDLATFANSKNCQMVAKAYRYPLS